MQALTLYLTNITTILYSPKMDPTIPPTSFFRFFDLPAELRTNILSHLLISKYGIVLYNCTLFGPTTRDKVTALYVFLVNIQMYQEASAIFYGKNRFIINGQSHRLPGHLTKPGGFLSSEGQDARRRVRSLYLYLTRVGGEFKDILAPAISDMILSGSLRRLKICLGPPSSHPGVIAPETDMMTKQPFQDLLNLLADPDLEHVQLCVWKVHWSIFCPFHSKGEIISKGNTPAEVVDVFGLATIRGHSDWIDLDWEGMVDQVGTGKRIAKINETCL
ncbi:hypothetical protein NUW58_g6779 [Xylaria curta]|uniref:Uncharacterized protein n=1 Tax=Xylaria curta TaxID=42375 RepID=A0ACC1NQ83_9PEZI|nr:hypothetical protein NUW58_g6779 [Xylaria curta]